MSHVVESVPGSLEADQDVTVIALLKAIQQEVRELKQEVREMKGKTGNSSESTELIIENPFEELESFGFKAKSLEERTRT